jgi:O-antigen ligase
MTATSYNEELLSPVTDVSQVDESRETWVWSEAWAWVALLPTLFITCRGSIEDDSSPYAFQFTAMDADPLPHRIARLACSLIIAILLATRFRGVLAAATKSKLLLLLPGIAFVSALWSQSPRSTFAGALNLLLTTLFAVYLYKRYPGERIVSFLAFAAFVSLACCVLSVTVFPSVGIDPRQQDAWRGIFGQRNNCAVACSLFLAVGLHARTRGLIDQLMRGSTIVLSLVFIVMSGSKQGWILAALTIALTYLLRFSSRIRSLDRLLFFMAIAVPFVLAVLFIQSNFTQVLAAMDKDPTMSQRTIIWAQVLPSIAKHPMLGYGYSAFWSGLNGESMQTVLTTKWVENQAQDGYLDVLLQLGVAGLIPLCLVFLRGFRQSYAAIVRNQTGRGMQLAIVLLPLMVAENIGESSFLAPVGIPWLYALVAFLILGRPDCEAEAL